MNYPALGSATQELPSFDPSSNTGGVLLRVVDGFDLLADVGSNLCFVALRIDTLQSTFGYQKYLEPKTSCVMVFCRLYCRLSNMSILVRVMESQWTRALPHTPGVWDLQSAIF